MFLFQDSTASESIQNAASFVLFDKLSAKFFIRLAIDLISVLILIRLIYYKTYRRTDLFLTFFAFNLVIFLVSNLLNKVEMSMGAAFGLFAVFSILRYRAESISTKDMTYLFLVIAIGLLTAIGKGGWDELCLLNGIILLLTQLLESNWIIKKDATKKVVYDNVELILPERKLDLINDLKDRTGLNINNVEILDIDFVKKATLLKIHYKPENI
jgi:Domain of unknown function (DUF4956)